MRQQGKFIVATILIIVSITVWLCYFVHWPPSVAAGVHREIGRNLAQEALKLLSNGGQVILIARDTSAFKQPAVDIQMKSLESALRKAGINVAHSRLIQLDPLKPMEVPPGDFFEIIRKAQPTDVIISLMGPPLLNPEQRTALVQPHAKVVAFCSGNLFEQSNLLDLFKEGLLHAAVVNRKVGGTSNSNLTAPTQSFDQLYQVLNASNASSLLVSGENRIPN